MAQNICHAFNLGFLNGFVEGGNGNDGNREVNF